jgi:hypothetical protein
MRLPTNREELSPIEEEFFRAGDEMSSNETNDHMVDCELVAPPQRSAWSRWFARASRPATDSSFAENENSDVAKI